MLEDILINMGVSALLVAIKNPKRREQLHKIFLKVFTTTGGAFASDAEFIAVAKAVAGC